MQQYEKLTTLIKPTVSRVANAGLLKAGEVCKRVKPTVKLACGVGCSFIASYHHAKACLSYKVKPKKNDPHPERTKQEFYHYDAAHKDYVYTEQWVTFLSEELQKPGQYKKVLA